MQNHMNENSGHFSHQIFIQGSKPKIRELDNLFWKISDGRDIDERNPGDTFGECSFDFGSQKCFHNLETSAYWVSDASRLNKNILTEWSSTSRELWVETLLEEIKSVVTTLWKKGRRYLGPNAEKMSSTCTYWQIQSIGFPVQANKVRNNVCSKLPVEKNTTLRPRWRKSSCSSEENMYKSKITHKWKVWPIWPLDFRCRDPNSRSEI